MSGVLLREQTGLSRAAGFDGHGMSDKQFVRARDNRPNMQKGAARRCARHGTIVAVYPARTCPYDVALSIANSHGLRVAVDRLEMVFWRAPYPPELRAAVRRAGGGE